MAVSRASKEPIFIRSNAVLSLATRAGISAFAFLLPSHPTLPFIVTNQPFAIFFCNLYLCLRVGCWV